MKEGKKGRRRRRKRRKRRGQQIEEVKEERKKGKGSFLVTSRRKKDERACERRRRASARAQRKDLSNSQGVGSSAHQTCSTLSTVRYTSPSSSSPLNVHRLSCPSAAVRCGGKGTAWLKAGGGQREEEGEEEKREEEGV